MQGGGITAKPRRVVLTSTSSIFYGHYQQVFHPNLAADGLPVSIGRVIPRRPEYATGIITRCRGRED